MALFRDRRGAEEFQALHEFARSELLGWITTLARSRRLALDPQDLLQDTFVNIYRYAGGFRDERPSSFRVWSRKIAANVIRRAMARQRDWHLEDFPAGMMEPVDARVGPREALQYAEEDRALTLAWMILLEHYGRAVWTLRERDRRALEMVEVQDLSYAEAARELGVGPSNMKMIVFRARKRVRAEMGRTLSNSTVPPARSGQEYRVAG